MLEQEAMELANVNQQIDKLIARRNELMAMFQTREYVRHILITRHRLAGRDADVILNDAKEDGETWFQSKSGKRFDTDTLTYDYGHYIFGYSQ